MNKDNNISNLLKDKLNKQEFEIQEEWMNEMSSQLDGFNEPDEPKGKRGILYILAGILIIIGFIGTIFVVNKTNKDNANNAIVENVRTIEDEENGNFEVADNSKEEKQSSKKTNTNIENEYSEEKTNTLENKNKTTKPNTAKIKKATTIKQNNKTIVDNKKSKVNKQKTSFNTNGINKKQNAKKERLAKNKTKQNENKEESGEDLNGVKENIAIVNDVKNVTTNNKELEELNKQKAIENALETNKGDSLEENISGLVSDTEKKSVNLQNEDDINFVEENKTENLIIDSETNNNLLVASKEGTTHDSLKTNASLDNIDAKLNEGDDLEDNNSKIVSDIEENLSVIQNEEESIIKQKISEENSNASLDKSEIDIVSKENNNLNFDDNNKNEEKINESLENNIEDEKQLEEKPHESISEKDEVVVEKKSVKKELGISVSLTAGPSVVFRNYQSENAKRNTEETNINAWNASLEINKTFNRFIVGTGVNVQNYGEKINYSSIDYNLKDTSFSYVNNTYRDVIVSRVGGQLSYVNSDYYSRLDTIISIKDSLFTDLSVTKENGNTNFMYVEVPLHFGYKILDTKKFDLQAKMGASIGFLTQSKGFYINDENILQKATSSNIMFNFLLSADFMYNIGKNISLTLSPHFKHNLNNLSTSKAIKRNYSTFGINGGIILDF